MEKATFARVMPVVRRVGIRSLAAWLFDAYGVNNFAKVRPNDLKPLLKEMEAHFAALSPPAQDP